MDRAERRRQAREDEQALARGLDADRADGPQIMMLMSLLHGRLEAARAARSIAPLMQFFERDMRAAWRAEPREAIACRKGCAFCCHAWVSATAPEVLLAKAAVPLRERDDARAAVEAAFAVTDAASPAERAAVAAPCPMLRGGACRIYSARPASCRTAVSLDAGVCERAFRPGAEPLDIPTPDFHLVMRRGYSIALAGALKQSGFPAALLRIQRRPARGPRPPRRGAGMARRRGRLRRGPDRSGQRPVRTSAQPPGLRARLRRLTAARTGARMP